MFNHAEEHLKTVDPIIAKLINRYGSCTLASHNDYFWALCEAIISQQLSAKAAETIAKRFLALYPKEEIDFNPSTILATPLEKITSVGISRSKASYIKDLAEKFDQVFLTQDFSPLDDEEIISKITIIKGIGRWTAEMFLIFSLNRLDVLPTGDLGIKRATQQLYGLADLPNPKQLSEIASCWKPYRSIASWYLWRSIDNK
ncbi:MAG: DNA-3-methyladenine glycosylase [Blastocatellia bacterium]